jgi:trimeric autotransporter adhesin
VRKLGLFPVAIVLAFLGFADTAVAQFVLAASPATVAFQWEQGAPTPPSQTVNVTSLTGSAISFTDSVAAGADSLFAVNVSSGTTPATLTVSLIPSELPILCPVPGSAGGYLVVTPPNGVKLLIQLTLNTTAAPLLINPPSLSFAYQVGQAPPANQTITVTSPTLLPFSVKTSYTAGAASNWLNVTPASGTTPGNLTVSLNSAVLSTAASGQYQATIGIASTTCSIDPDIVVTLSLTAPAASPLSASPDPINITVPTGSTTTLNQALTVAASAGISNTLSFLATVSQPSGANWLSVNPASTQMVTPGGSDMLTVSVNPAGLSAGMNYTGEVVLTPSGGGAALSIPVNLVVGGSTFIVLPNSLNFAVQTGTASPHPQPLVITGLGAGQTYRTTISYQPSSLVATQNWLSISPSSGTPADALALTTADIINPGALGPGTYNATVTVLSGSSAATASVNLLVSSEPVLTLGLGGVTFDYPDDGNPNYYIPAGPFTLTSPGPPRPVSVTTTNPAEITGSSSLLTATPSSGMTPAKITFSLNPSVASSLAVGTHVGVVNIFPSAEPTGAPQSTLPYIIQVTPQAGPTTPDIKAVVNAASDGAGAVSPGEIITLFGANVGPATAAYLTLAAGKVSTKIGNTQVLFDGVAAPLIYVSATQINAIVPYEIAGRAVTEVLTIFNGAASAPFLLSVADTAPAIFTDGENGTGQGAILNQNGTVNGASNPAAPGSIISIYATGEGQLNPPGVTGSVTPNVPPFPKPVAPVSVTIGGQPAQIDYAGEAPGLVSGVLQVNAAVPHSLPAGRATLVITFGANSSQGLVTVQVE